MTIAEHPFEKNDLVRLRSTDDETPGEADFVVHDVDGDDLVLRRPSPWRQFTANMRDKARSESLRRAVRS